MQTEQREKLWQERISSYQGSGLSIRDWCQEQGLPDHQLRYWLKKSLTGGNIKPVETSNWIAMGPNDPAPNSGVSLRIGTVTLEVQRGFDPQVLLDVVHSLSRHAE